MSVWHSVDRPHVSRSGNGEQHRPRANPAGSTLQLARTETRVGGGNRAPRGCGRPIDRCVLWGLEAARLTVCRLFDVLSLGRWWR